MTVFVTPDLIGRLLLPAEQRLPVGAGNDVEGRPAMTVFVTPDLIGRLLLIVTPDLIGRLFLIAPPSPIEYAI